MRNVLISLISGVLAAGIILDFKTGRMFTGLNSICKVFQNEQAAKSIFFCLMIGGFVHIIEASGGVQGMVRFLIEKKKIVKSPFGAQLIAYLIGIIFFIDGMSSIVISGVASRTLFDNFDVPRHKLAYITDSTASPVAWLIPFNAAGAFLIAMLGGMVSQGIVDIDPFQTLLSAMPYQLYGIVSIIVVGTVIFRGRNNQSRNIHKAEIKKELSVDQSGHKITDPKARNMILPLLFLIVFVFGIMLLTDDGSSGIYIGVILTLITTGIYYIMQNITTIENYLKWVVKGMSNYLGMVIILTLAFAFSNLVSQLGTGLFIASVTNGINPAFLPLIIFVIGAVISFATGTSAGTVAILIPIVLPMAISLNVDIPILIGSIISGGVFGDHCSPISDSTILSSMVAEIHVMEHVKTQMPYALTAAAISSICFLFIGFVN
jgi:Na+/H+ antiporter NhaC